MNALHFAYWLQGYFELSPAAAPLTTAQVALIQEHLALVFKKETNTLETLSDRPERAFLLDPKWAEHAFPLNPLWAEQFKPQINC